MSGLSIEVDDTLPLSRGVIPDFMTSLSYGDSARPELVSFMRERGAYIESCFKWGGSIKDGIAHLLNYKEIVIHPSCQLSAREFMDYSYKVDRFTGEILDEPNDKDNNSVDATRYALQDIILESHAIISPRSLVLKSSNDLLNHILDNHRHMNFFVTYVASEKIVFQHLIAVSKITKKVMVLKENVIVDTKKGDASAYYSASYRQGSLWITLTRLIGSLVKSWMSLMIKIVTRSMQLGMHFKI